ncbi:hypothetical protein B7P43_G09689 [Cryptotermes secundus]|uniref:Tc1-like transposase DDE domain-containing protein n=1 Tax=Cryptotermes secundus TaxID=105785 RepID=A0A2J7Q797_9NEOP|nr:hypothetical protein B7P43_G09689 [Cryptotermes secundus]
MQFSKMTVSPFTQLELFSLGLKGMKVNFQHFSWPAQSPALNLTERLWSVLDTRVRNRFPPPTSLEQLEDVLQEEWYKIPLEALQNVHFFFPKIAAVQKAKGGPIPYS